MAIRIDLLPGSVKLQRWFQRLIVLAVLLVASVGSILYLVYYKNHQKLEKYLADADAIETYAKQAETVQAATAATQAETQPMQNAINFMSDASKTGAERAALLDLIRSYLYYDPNGGAVVNTMDISDGANVKLAGIVRTPDDYSRFLLKLRDGSTDKGGPLYDGLPIASGIVGFPPPLAGKNGTGTNGAPGTNGQQGQPIAANENILVLPNPFTAAGKLKHPIVMPPDPVGGAAPGAGGAGSSGRPAGYP